MSQLRPAASDRSGTPGYGPAGRYHHSKHGTPGKEA
jgi:hypothetical protein